jgi:hypothetical protein
MVVAVGESIPDVAIKVDHPPQPVELRKRFAGKKVLASRLDVLVDNSQTLSSGHRRRPSWCFHADMIHVSGPRLQGDVTDRLTGLH